MQMKSMLSALTLAAMAAAGLSTAALAERGPGRDRAQMMPMFDIAALDADQDGKVTKAEMDAARLARVTAADANADGQLNAEELAAMELARMTERAADRAGKMIERFDADADGQLSAAELAAGPQPVAMFDRIDTDGDGAISQAEVDAAQERMAERGKHRGHGGPRGND